MSQIGGIDGLDWDIEIGGSFPTADAIWISSQLKATYGADFAITMAPNGTNKAAYRSAAAQMHTAGCLDWIGQQYYDAAVSLSEAKGNIAEYIAAGIPASKMGVGMAVGPTYSGAGYWTQQQCIDYMTDIRSTYGIRRCYLWSEEANLGSAATWVNNMRTVVGA